MSGASKNNVVQARHSVLLQDGTLAAGARPRMEEEFLLEALRWMMKSRLYDSRVIGLQRQGQFGVYSGLAWGLKLRGDDSVVLAYIGEGGSSEGDFHEALNLAGTKKAPIIFFLSNNQWAISTSRKVQSATASFALRAAGYGFEGVQVDGNDVMAVYDVALAAVERARAGGGPTLIESVTYRMGFHNTTDNPSRYQDPKEYEDARARDPIERVQKYLAGLGLWDQKREADLAEELREENEAALQLAIAAPAPGPADLFTNIYERPPERFLQQRAEMLDGRQD